LSRALPPPPADNVEPEDVDDANENEELEPEHNPLINAEDAMQWLAEQAKGLVS
jgi:hypothetical protein